MSIRTIFFFFYLFISLSLFSQDRHWQNWCFGVRGGMSFNDNPISQYNSGFGFGSGSEGVTTMSDKEGNLQFYACGNRVFNKMHGTMVNGTGLNSHTSSSQGTLALPCPGSDSLYFLFTVDASENNFVSGLSYNIIDMSLQGGNGEVIVKNIIIEPHVTERMTFARHANGIDFWVIVHKWGSRDFLSYLVSDTGVVLNPVVSSIGKVHGGGTYNALGCMRVSQKGDKLACAIWDENVFELFKFNNATGALSDPITSPANNDEPYGVEFSYSGNRLYTTSYWGKQVSQWDVSTWDSASIWSSSTLLGTYPGFFQYAGGLSLGHDRKIYCANNQSDFLGVINCPEELGGSCNFDMNGLDLLGANKSTYGLPQSLLSPIVFHTDSQLCFADTVSFFINDTLFIDSVVWNFGDLGSTVNNVSNSFCPKHEFSDTGTFDVQLVYYFNCSPDTYTTFITITSEEPEVILPDDTTFCHNTILSVDVMQNGCQYLWQDSSMQSSYNISQAGLYWVIKTNVCGEDRDSINVQYSDLFVNLGSDLDTICDGDTLFVDAYYPEASYLWSDASTTSSFTITQAGLYWVEVTDSNDCEVSDSIAISLVSISTNMTNSDPDCEASPIIIELNDVYDSYLWSTGENTASIVVQNAGIYSVQVTRDGCSTSDFIDINALMDEDCAYTYYLPNAFSPSLNGVNHTYKLLGQGVETFELSIYDRWNKKVIQLNEGNNIWDGTYRNKNVSEGVYLYALEGRFNNGEEFKEKGSLMLLR